jgi:hypothetical protein
MTVTKNDVLKVIDTYTLGMYRPSVLRLRRKIEELFNEDTDKPTGAILDIPYNDVDVRVAEYLGDSRQAADGPEWDDDRDAKDMDPHYYDDPLDGNDPETQ